MRTRAFGFIGSIDDEDQPAWKSTMFVEGRGGSSRLAGWMGLARTAPTVAGSIVIFLALLVAAGWTFDDSVLEGRFLSGPSAPMAAVLLTGLIGAAVLLLRLREGRDQVTKGWRTITGHVLAAIAGICALAFLLNEVGEGLDIFWADEGAWARPSVPTLIVVLLFSLALIMLDRDPPRHRWGLVFAPTLGVVILIGLLSHGYQVQALLDPDIPLEISLVSAASMLVLYIGYICLRPNRGLIGFLLSEGPGPSMARYLVPTAIILPLLIGTGEFLASEFGDDSRSLGQGIGEMLVLIVLLFVVAVSSLRLQSYYARLREATSAVAEQADVLRGMTEGVAVVRISDTRIILTNPQFDAMHGYPRGGLNGKHVDETRPGPREDWEVETYNRVAAELTEKGSSKYISRARKLDGEEIWCRCTVQLTEHPVHGGVMIIVKTDITEEQQERKARESAEHRFRQVFEQSPIGLCLVHPDGSFDNVNSTFEKITGYTAEELYGMTFADITHPDDLAADLKQTKAMFDGETQGFEMEKRYIRKDGQTVWIYLTVRLLQSPDGGVDRALSMVEDITERHELSRQLRHLADHDPLTGLFNRRRFEDELESAITGDGNGHDGIAILNIDLDNFKFVNDTYGHSVGDQLIIRTAELLQGRLRASDTLARQGGDEFVVVLRDIEREGALRIAEELTALIAADVRVDAADYSARVTASIGVAFAEPGQDISEEKLMIHADVAMYEAKDSGRNTARLYDPQEVSMLGQSLDWVEKIRTALSHDGFLLYAQPVAAFADGDVAHHELFIRMKLADGSIVAPGAFLPVAERHDLVQEIDQWVVREAIGILAGTAGRGNETRLCVNLSGRSVGDPKLLEVISAELERTGADPSGLIFEVTETSAIGNIASAQAFAASLARLGCRFALDDFGTGFASFYYLKHISCDYVKIDGEFVRNIALDPTDRLLVRALVEISNGMGKMTIAEQVEDAETLELLREYGVNFVQGYHIGRPMPVDEVDLNSTPQVRRHQVLSPSKVDPAAGGPVQ